MHIYCPAVASGQVVPMPTIASGSFSHASTTTVSVLHAAAGNWLQMKWQRPIEYSLISTELTLFSRLADSRALAF
jgi:hypothetical protein